MRLSRLWAISFALLVALTYANPVAAATDQNVLDPNGNAMPGCSYRDEMTSNHSLDDWRSTLVDTIYRLPSTYRPNDLTSTSRAGLRGGSVRAFVIDDLRAMVDAAKADGAALGIASSFRSYSTQRSLFNRYVNRDGWNRAVTYSARPGHSEHQLGLAIDFKTRGGGAPWIGDWGRTKAGAWMRENAWKFGFIMSYPRGASDTVCYIYEPWHYRYFGREQAAEMHDSGLTTRQFLWHKYGA